MKHTESDLRTLLEEYTHDPAGRQPVPHLKAIVRRGRRTRRVRRALGAGTALAVAATATVLLTGPLRTGQGEAAQPPALARIEAPPKLREEFPVVLGAERSTLSLIHSERFSTTGAARTVTFTPTSHFTGYEVVCGDPRAWIVISSPLKGGEDGGTSGRCEGGGGGHHDKLSVPSGWLKGPQSIKVWVFPADAPVVKVAEELGRCVPSGESTTCDEQAAGRALRNQDVLDRLSAEVGERPGEWAVGIYDSPSPGPATTADSSGRPSPANATTAEPPERPTPVRPHRRPHRRPPPDRGARPGTGQPARPRGHALGPEVDLTGSGHAPGPAGLSRSRARRRSGTRGRGPPP
ncbi:hypothetical protein ACFQYP_41180 [Nonomuraea antimicrobica]